MEAESMNEVEWYKIKHGGSETAWYATVEKGYRNSGYLWSANLRKGKFHWQNGVTADDVPEAMKQDIALEMLKV
jgi:hypothetical protein